MVIFRVGQKVTWNHEGNPEIAARFAEKYGEIVTVHKIEWDNLSITNHSQIIWLSDSMSDRFTGWWFQPVSGAFSLDAIA